VAKAVRAPGPTLSFSPAARQTQGPGLDESGARSVGAVERVLLFDAGGHVHSFDRDTGEHHWSSSFGPPLLSSYSRARAARRLVPLLGNGGGVLDVETGGADRRGARSGARRGDAFDRHLDLDLDDDPNDGRGGAGGSGGIGDIRNSREIDVRGEGRLNLHNVRLAAQLPGSQGSHNGAGITVTPLPKIPAMVAASPFSLSFSPGRAVNVLGSHNTTMFKLDLTTGKVGSYICASQPGTAGGGPSSPPNNGNKCSTIWIGRTDSVLRAFDRRHNEEMWNVSSSQVQPQPIEGLSDPPQRIYESSSTTSAGADNSNGRNDNIFVDEIVTRAGFQVTFMETAVVAGTGSLRRHSRVLWDTITESRHLASPISSAYLVAGGADNLQISPISVKHMVPRYRDDPHSSSSSDGFADEAYIHAYGEGTEMFGLSRSQHYFNTSGDISVMPHPRASPSLALPDGLTTASSSSSSSSSLWMPNDAEFSHFVDRVFPIKSPSWTADNGDLLLPSPFDNDEDGTGGGAANNISNIIPNLDVANQRRFNESTILLLLVALAIMMILLLILLAVVYRRGDKLRKDMARLTSSSSFSSSLSSDGKLRMGSGFVPPLMIADTPEKVLGNGSHGTVVYAGKFGGRPVAIKRMLRQFYELAEREIALLTRSDGHPNLVRYHAHEVRGDFIYLGLEQCESTLSDFLDRRARHMKRHGPLQKQRRNTTGGVVLDEVARKIWCADRHARRSALLGLISGVQHIHSLRIVHRDLKPQNVLLVRCVAVAEKREHHTTAEEDKLLPRALRWSSWMLKISDMGLGKALSGQRSSFGHASLFGKRASGSGNDAGTGTSASNGTGAGTGEADGTDADAPSQVGGAPLRTSSGLGGVGTEGYLAPELLSNTTDGIADDRKSRTTRSVDIFSLGCVLFEAFSESRQHLFGGMWERQHNILEGKVAVPEAQLGDDMLGVGIGHIVLAMTNQQPERRPSADEVMNHPAFWTTDRWLRFLEEFSDRAGHQDEPNAAAAAASADFVGASQQEILAALERTPASIIGLSWDARLGQTLQADLNNFRRYDTASVQDCLRFIRNKRHHLHELSAAAVRAVGSTDRHFFDYFFDPLLQRFPKLPMRCVEVARTHCTPEPMFAKYFVPSKKTSGSRGSRASSAAAEPFSKKSDAVKRERGRERETATETAAEKRTAPEPKGKPSGIRARPSPALSFFPSTKAWVQGGRDVLGCGNSDAPVLALPARIPKRYKTKMCKYWRNHSECENTVCTFALHPHELRIKEPIGAAGLFGAPPKPEKKKNKNKKKKKGRATPSSLAMLAMVALLLVVFLPATLKAISAKSLKIHPPLAFDDWNHGHEVPDVVGGHIFGNVIFLRIFNSGREKLERIVLEVEESVYLQETRTPMPIDLESKQRTSIHAPLAQKEGGFIPKEACPLQVSLRLRVGVGGKLLRRHTMNMLCRELHDRFSFVYIDFDGSPQVAAAKFPKAGCPKEMGCAVYFTTKGMDVTAQRQADALRPKDDMWILAPHARGTHSFNWQGPGFWSGRRALVALQERAQVWSSKNVTLAEPYRILFSGHSNGGFGAWIYGANFPDEVLGVVPLAGMATMGTTELNIGKSTNTSLWDIVERSVLGYRGHLFSKNLVHRPFFASTGLGDRVVSPRSTQQMGELLAKAGVQWAEGKLEPPLYGVVWKSTQPRGLERRIVFLEEKEHWWWDTVETNDGGAMDDDQIRDFVGKAVKKPLLTESKLTSRQVVNFACASPVLCGSCVGVRILQQRTPCKISSLRIKGGKKGTLLRVKTRNVERLSIRAVERVKAVKLDGQSFVLNVNRLYCRTTKDEGNVWTNDPAECNLRIGRSLEALGPMRRIFAKPFALVYGTHGSQDSNARYRAAAIALANTWAVVGGGVAAVVPDNALDTVRARNLNLILLGGARTNSAARKLSSHQPFEFLDADGAVALLEGGFRLGSCNYAGKGYGLVSLGPRFAKEYAAHAHGVVQREAGLIVTIAGTTLNSFSNALEMFKSNLFVTNSWQHRIPEFIVSGPGYSHGQNAHTTLNGVLAAGWWGNHWEFRPETSVTLECK
jgi:serine/threonine protein kinase